MAILPQPTDSTVQRIYAAYESLADDGHRVHLGASLIGSPCRRYLWLLFRWSFKNEHPGRVLKLFGRGHREERTFYEDLRRAGCVVQDINPETGEQFNFSDIGGHFGGSCDGKIAGLVEAPKTVHILELKTHSKKSFDHLSKHGVQKSKPMHFDQMQIYMYWSGLKRAYYLAVCKDDDRLYGERVHFDEARAETLVNRARAIIESPVPLERVNEDPTWYECKFCDARAICREGAGANVNCRTCVHSTPETDTDTARWSCAYWQCDIPAHAQRDGCENHIMLPDLISWARQVDGSAEENWIEYQTPGGKKFRNVGKQNRQSNTDFTSEEISAMDEYSLDQVSTDSFIQELRQFGGEVIEYEKNQTQPRGNQQ